MTVRRFPKFLLLLVELSLLAPGILAKTGTCDDSMPACTIDNTCPVGPCTVWIQLDKSNRVMVSLKKEGPHQEAICVATNQTIVWTEGNDFSGTFDVEFGFFSNPFKGVFSNVFKGSVGRSKSGVISGDLSHSCYKYSVEQCSSAIECGQLDPKVVIKPVQFQ